MKQYKALIVEDLPREATFLAGQLSKLFPDIELLQTCDTLAKAKKALETEKPDLIFLDIELGTQNGFDLLPDVRPLPFKVIFVTGREDRDTIVQAFRLSAVDYLHKPYGKDELENAVKKALDALNTEDLPGLSDKIELLLQNLSKEKGKPKLLALVNNEGERLVPVSDILYIRTGKEDTTPGKVGVRVLFKLTNGEDIILSNTSLNHYEKILVPYHFARASQSYLVNLPNIKIYKKKGGEVIMKENKNDALDKTEEEGIFITGLYRERFDKLYDDFSNNLL